MSSSKYEDLDNFRSVIIDTSILIFLALNPERIPAKIMSWFSDTDNMIFVSSISIQEIIIKVKSGKLVWNNFGIELLDQYQKKMGMSPLSFSHAHAYELNRLPEYHKDPFDRALIAQALAESSAIITSDKVFEKYPVKTILL